MKRCAGSICRKWAEEQKDSRDRYGCGYLQDIVADYTGFDILPTAKQNYHKAFVLGSATAMPFPDNTFDAIWTIWVLEHIPEPEEVSARCGAFSNLAANCCSMSPGAASPRYGDGFDVRP